MVTTLVLDAKYALRMMLRQKGWSAVGIMLVVAIVAAYLRLVAHPWST